MTAFLYRKKAWLFAAVMMLSLASLWPITSLQIDNSVEIWFYEEDPGLQDYLQYLENFGSWDYLVIAAEAKDGIYSPGYLQALRDVTRRIENIDNVVKVTSLANAKDNFVQDDGLSYRTVLQDNINAGAAAQLKQRLESNTVYVDGLIKRAQDKTSLLLIQTVNRYGDKSSYRIALMKEIRRIMDAEQTFATYHVVGTPNMNAELNKSSKRDMLVFYPLVSLFVTLMAWLIFRSVRDIAVTFAVVVAAIVLSVGSMMGAGYELNMVTIMMGAILMSLSVASVVHLITTYHQIKKTNPDFDGLIAAKHSIKELWVPCLCAALTTMFGFLSLTTTKILPVTLLGVFSAFGILLTFALTVTLGAVMLPVLWKNRANPRFDCVSSGNLTNKSVQSFYLAWMEKLTAVTTSQHMAVIAAYCVVGGVLLFGLFSLQADSNYLTMFKDGTKVSQAYHAVEDAEFGTSVLTIQISAEEGVEQAEVFRGMQSLQRDITKLDYVRKVISPVDIIQEVDKAFAEDPGNWRPGLQDYGRQAFAQLILVAESSGNGDLADYLSMDHRRAQISVFTDYLSGRQTTDLKRRLQQLINTHLPPTLPHVRTTITGVPVMWANMDGYLFKSQSTSLLLLAVAIFILLLIFLRSLPLAFIGLAVNLLPIGMILGLMGHLDVKINMATILIGGIAMGIAVDDTIHFLWRYKTELQRGSSHITAVRNTLERTGIALVLTSVLLIGGFAVMMLSDFTPTADFGLFTSLTVFLALVTDLLLLPSLLSIYQRSAKTRLQYAQY